MEAVEMERESLRDHANTASNYALRAKRGGTFLGKTEDFWRGAAATYLLIADSMLDEVVFTSLSRPAKIEDSR